MGYAPLSDQFYLHPKVLALGRSKAALALWTVALSYVTGHLTDGFVPISLPSRLVGRPWQRWSTALVDAGLWDVVEGGFRFHDFLEWQRSRNEITELRRKRAIAGALGGQAKAASKTLASASAHGNHLPEQDPTHVSTRHVSTRHDTDTSTTPPVVPPPVATAPKPSRSALLAQSSPPGFERFWAAYPKRVGKDAARKAWRVKHCEPCAETVVAALTRQLGYLNRDNGKYIPNPATWLTEGRWQDDPPERNGHMQGFGDLDMSGIESFLERHKHDEQQQR